VGTLQPIANATVADYRHIVILAWRLYGLQGEVPAAEALNFSSYTRKFSPSSSRGWRFLPSLAQIQRHHLLRPPR
ncbi:MAG TPA: hypothetical protein V6D20_15995, partial [Candidatus Obscuribacterales bacterium]